MSTYIYLALACFVAATSFAEPVLLVIYIPIGAIWLIIGSSRSRARHAKENQAERLAIYTFLVKKHSDTLRRKYRQTVYKNDYGVYIFDKWFQEVDYFIDRVILLERPEIIKYVDRKAMTKIIHTEVDSEQSSDSVSEYVEGMSGNDFEHHCAQLLQTAGWDARVTKASGDQGIDIVAKLGSLHAVFQCKHYSSAVGNAAVQEIIAGMAFEGASIGAVVSNASYTTSARQLAASTGVHLLHHDELSTFASRVEA